MKTTTRMTGMTAILLVCFLTGVGCIKIDSALTLDKDGGGALRTVYAMPTFLVKQMETSRQLTRSMVFAGGGSSNAPLPAIDIPMVFDEAVLQAKFKRMEADGLMLESLRFRDQGGWKFVDFTLKFKRFEALAAQSFFKDCGFRFSRMDDGSCKLVIRPPEIGVSSGLPDMGNPETMAKLTPFLSGMRVVARIDFPGEIRNSNSTMSDNFRATWEWDYEKDVRVLDRLAKDSMITVFDGRVLRMRGFEKPAGSLVAK